MTQQVVVWKGYKGACPLVPQAASLDPKKTDETSSPFADLEDRKSNEIVYSSGCLEITNDEKYTFYSNTETGAEHSLHGITVLMRNMIVRVKCGNMDQLNKKLKQNNDLFRPGSYYVKKFHYQKLDFTGTSPYFGCNSKLHM